MIIKIKSKEEIKKTLKENNRHKHSHAWFSPEMYNLCGKSIKAVNLHDSGYHGYKVNCVNWRWHPDWYEVVEVDLTQEDLFIIKELDEMLEFFMESYV